jgi:predicted transcriptional regulator of viral defense system
MPPTTTPQKILRLAKRSGVLRSKDLDPLGIPRAYLQRLVEAGDLERTGRGLYIIPSAEVTEHHSLVEASRRVPLGVVCLLSALRFHGITTQSPFEVWIAIDANARTPRVDHPPLRVVRMAKAPRDAGVEIHRIEGADVKIHSAPKTVVDCFKFRNKIGLDVALEALRDYWRSRKRNADALWRYAKICRVANVMRPYIEALG